MSNASHFDPPAAPSPLDDLKPIVHPDSPKAAPVGVSSLRYSVAIPADWLTTPWLPGIAPKPAPAPVPAKPSRRKVKSKTVDEVALRREAKRAKRLSPLEEYRRIEDATFRRVDALFVENAMANLSIPMHAIAVLGSLVTASVLQVIAQASEQAMKATGSPWAARAHELDWTNAAGINRDEWIQARRILREAGLIQERSRLDPKTERIVVEFAFDPEAWRAELETARWELVDRFLAEQGATPPDPLAG